MSRYFCPFCSSSYQIHTTNSDGVLICGHCGDPLMKKPVINARKIFGLFAVSAFLAPFLIMFVFVFEDFTKPELPSNSESESSLLLTVNN